MMPVAAVFTSNRLVHLTLVDLVIVVLYFAMVLGIGFYLKRFANTSEDFFLAGREMGIEVPDRDEPQQAPILLDRRQMADALAP